MKKKLILLLIVGMTLFGGTTFSEAVTWYKVTIIKDCTCGCTNPGSFSMTVDTNTTEAKESLVQAGKNVTLTAVPYAKHTLVSIGAGNGAWATTANNLKDNRSLTTTGGIWGDMTYVAKFTQTHTCVPSGTYTKDSTSHWKVCVTSLSCGKIIGGKIGHIGGTSTNGGKCTTCGYPYIEQIQHNCVASPSYTTDASSHWKICSTAGCGKIAVAKQGHYISGTYEKDANSHWKICTICYRIMNTGYHTGGTSTNGGKCATCGYLYVTQTAPQIHTCTAGNPDNWDYSGWNADSTTHFEKCSICKARMNSKAHLGGTSTNGGKCTTCGYVYVTQTAPQIHTCVAGNPDNWDYSGWNADSTTHFEKCSICKARMNSKAHLGGTSTNGGKCTTCGYAYVTQQVQHTCTPSSTYTKDGTNHWKLCTASNCGKIAVAKAVHTGGTATDGGKCITCGYPYITQTTTPLNPTKYKITLKEECSCNADPGEFTSNLSEVTDTSTPIILTVKPNATHRVVSVGDKYTPEAWTNVTNYVGTVQIQGYIGAKEDTTFIATFTDVTPAQQPSTFNLTLNKSCKCGCSNAGTFVTSTGSTTVSQGTVVRLTAKPNDATTHKLEFIKVGSGYVYPEQLVNGDSIDVDVNMDATYEAVFAKKTTENIPAVPQPSTFNLTLNRSCKCGCSNAGTFVTNTGSTTVSQGAVVTLTARPNDYTTHKLEFIKLGGSAYVYPAQLINGDSMNVIGDVYMDTVYEAVFAKNTVVNPEVHTCTASTVYTTDAASHWKLCSTAGCGKIVGAKGSHTGGTATNGGKCTVCQIVYVEQHTCTASTVYTTDATSHWKICSTVGCGKIVGSKVSHTGGTATNGGKCTVCKIVYVPQTVHTCIPSTTYITDLQYHYLKCSVAGCTETVMKGFHEGGTATNGGKCTVCLAPYVEQVVHRCTASTLYTTDTTSHWKVCSTVGCGKIVGEKGSHTGGTATNGGKCTVCKIVYVAQQHICSASTVYTTDATSHWKLCSVASCGKTVGEKGLHTGGTATNGGKCTVCQIVYVAQTVHTCIPSTTYITDLQYHYQKCSVAGCENILMKGFHEGGTAANGGKCTVCGYAYLNVAIDPNHVHKYTISKLSIDGKRHYYACEVCETMPASERPTAYYLSYESGDKCITSPVHTLNNGVCTIATCNYGKNVNPVTPPTDKSGWLFNDYAAKYKNEPGIDNAWAYDSLKNMKELGFVKGNPNTTGGYDLLPNDKFVTLHLMSLMSRILQSDGSKTTISSNVYGVSNVEKSAGWAVADYKYIMSRYGQVYGDNTGKAMVNELFPNNPNDWFAKVLTREEAGAMIGILFGGSDIEQTNFPDWNSVGSNYKKGVSQALNIGVMSGDKNEITGVTLINPKNELTRIQGIVLMENLYNALNGMPEVSDLVITQI